MGTLHCLAFPQSQELHGRVQQQHKALNGVYGQRRSQLDQVFQEEEEKWVEPLVPALVPVGAQCTPAQGLFPLQVFQDLQSCLEGWNQ